MIKRLVGESILFLFSFTVNGIYCKRGCTKRSLLAVTACLVLPRGAGGGGGRERESSSMISGDLPSLTGETILLCNGNVKHGLWSSILL